MAICGREQLWLFPSRRTGPLLSKTHRQQLWPKAGDALFWRRQFGGAACDFACLDPLSAALSAEAIGNPHDLNPVVHSVWPEPGQDLAWSKTQQRRAMHGCHG